MFLVDYIIVLGKELLQFKLERDVPNFVKIVLMPKSGGVSFRCDKVNVFGGRCECKRLVRGQK